MFVEDLEFKFQFIIASNFIIGLNQDYQSMIDIETILIRCFLSLRKFTHVNIRTSVQLQKSYFYVQKQTTEFYQLFH